MLISALAIAQDAGQISSDASGHAGRAVEYPMDYAGIRYISNNRRDPFLNPLKLKNTSDLDEGNIVRRLPPLGIAGTCIDELLFEGTSFRNDRRLAIVRSVDKHAYFLEEGARLLDGYLKTIHGDSIILVRETKSGSGKIMTQDVIKQLRKP